MNFLSIENKSELSDIENIIAQESEYMVNLDNIQSCMKF